MADLASFLVTSHRFPDRADSGAADQDAFLSMGLARTGEAGIDRRLVGNVYRAGDPPDLRRDGEP